MKKAVILSAVAMLVAFLICPAPCCGQFIKEGKKSIPIIATPDVLVVGGGPAGVGAAIAAARSGAQTMLVGQTGI